MKTITVTSKVNGRSNFLSFFLNWDDTTIIYSNVPPWKPLFEDELNMYNIILSGIGQF